MGLSVECIAMLNHMNKPAFITDNAVIIHVNKEAMLLGITENSPLSEVSDEAISENEVITKIINDVSYMITASKIGDYRLYVLEQCLQQQQLLSLLRAAQHLRRPLGALTSSINNITEQIRRTEDHDAIINMQKATRQLFMLLRTVRNMSDVTDFLNKRYHKLEHINVSEFIRELCEKLSAHFAKSDVTINASIADEDLYCNINAQLLERAIYNMISNSLKANSNNILISLKKTGKQLRITVTDDGSGMSDEEKARILSKFKDEPALSFENYGLGLGMLIIHAAAAAHNGTILITDAKPKGCQITLTMEISKEAPVLRQTPKLIRVDPVGGIDSLLIELADHLPSEIF